MKRYIALLRGVNISGKSKLRMEDKARINSMDIQSFWKAVLKQNAKG